MSTQSISMEDLDRIYSSRFAGGADAGRGEVIITYV